MSETLKELKKTFACKLDEKLKQTSHEKYPDTLIERANFCRISPHQLYNWRSGRTFIKVEATINKIKS